MKLHRYVIDNPGQVVEGLTILPYPQRGHKQRVNHSKNVNSTCIRTVFKMKRWNFTRMSTTTRDRSWRGWRFYRSPTGVRNKGLITQKTWIRRAFAQFSRWRVESSQERRQLFGTGRGRADDSTISSQGSEIRVNYPQKTWIRRAFVQFSRWRVETSQERQGIPVTGRRGVDISTVPP